MNERVKRWTPGPWDRSRYHHPNRDIVSRTGPGDNDSRPTNRYICMVTDRDPKEKEANARLIAAAPALVEALESMIEVYRRIDDATESRFWEPDDEDALEDAKAALAMAYGETQ